MLRSITFGLAAAMTISQAAPASARDGAKAETLPPTSTWQVNYADDSCRLAGIFGDGDRKTALILDRFQPGDRFFLTIAGAPLKPFTRKGVSIAFGPGGRVEEGGKLGFTFGSLGKFEPAIMRSGMTLLPVSDMVELDEEGTFDPSRMANDTNKFDQEITPEQEAAIEWLEVSRGKLTPVRLALTNFGPAMAAMRACTDELLTHWGLNLDAHRKLRRGAAPLMSPARWLKSSDYPMHLVRAGQQGFVSFRLIVGEDGVPQSCHIQQSTRPQEFDDLVCKKLIQRARFAPALDAQGEPIKSYYLNNVLFHIPG